MQTNSQNDRDFDHDHAYMENTQHEALQPLVQDNSQEGAPDADTHSVHVLRCPGIDSNDQLWDSNTTPNSSTSEAPSYSKIYSDEHVVREIIHVEDDHQKPQIGTPNSLRVPITWRQRITVYVIFVMVASTLMLVATAAFISFLWFGNQSSRLWRKIALSEWMPRAITLSALIVRLAVSLQAGLTTSMLASLVIEGDSVRLIDALEISMARFSNAGPHTLLWPCVRQSKSIALVILHIALVLTTLAAQFASTFLLSDVAIAGQITLAENNTFSYGFSTDYPVELTLESSTAPDYWIQPPRNFPTFGEYFLEPDIDDKIDDTGLVLRSFLPIPAQSTRESLHRYDGSAFTYDARIACTRPVFKNLTTCISSDRDQGYLCGEILPENVPENATINLDAIPFKCYVPLSTCAFKEPCSDPAWTVCPLDISAGGLIPILDPTNNASLIHVWDNGTDIPSSTGRGKWKAQTGNREWPVGVGNAYLLVNATNASIVHADWHGDVSYTGAWTDVYSEDDSVVSSKEPLRATLCYDAL
jgi:hypothetical protein